MTSQYTNDAGYGLGAQAVAYAARYLGVPYVWGGTTPQGFDCSGLVQFVYNGLGVTLPRTSQEQASSGIAVSPQALQPGDLIFYSEPGEGANSHEAIYAGNNQAIEAPHTGANVMLTGIDWAHFSGARRVTGGAASSATGGLTPNAATAGLFTNPLASAANLAISVPLILGAVALVVIGLWKAFDIPKPQALPIPI